MQIYFSSSCKILTELGISTSIHDSLLAIQYRGKDVDLELLSLAINSFRFKAILCIDDDNYLYNSNEKIKEFNRAFGKSNLLELRKQQVLKKDNIINNKKYYIDLAICNNSFPNKLISKLVESIYQEKMIYLSLSNENPNIPYVNEFKYYLNNFYNNNLFVVNNLRLFAIDTLNSERFLIFLGNDSLVLNLKNIYISRGIQCSQNFDAILDSHIRILPPNTNSYNVYSESWYYRPDQL